MDPKDRKVLPNIPCTSDNFCRTYTLENYDVEYLHFHTHIEIGICLSGNGISYVDDTEYTFTTDDVQIVFPFQNHFSKNTDKEESLWNWITIDYENLFETVGFVDIDNIQKIIKKEMAIYGVIDKRKYPEVRNLIQKLVKTTLPSYTKHSYLSELQTSLFLSLIMELWSNSINLPKLSLPSTNSSLMAISPALNIIRTSIKDGCAPKIAELCYKCGMSPTHFRRVFTKELGVTPHEYLDVCRIRKAKKLLASTNISMTEISNNIGYGNISSFNRIFLKHTGMTPSQFRNNFWITKGKYTK